MKNYYFLVSQVLACGRGGADSDDVDSSTVPFVFGSIAIFCTACPLLIVRLFPWPIIPIAS
jgi:hypothetical protein